MQYKDGSGWRQHVRKQLGPLGVTCFDPYDKPFVYGVEEDDFAREEILRRSESDKPEDIEYVDQKMREIRSYDLNLVDRADFIIAHIVPNLASWGSAEELIWACRLKKPTFISVEGGKKKTPLWLRGVFPYDHFYDGIENVLDYLYYINESGDFDHYRWRLLKEDYR